MSKNPTDYRLGWTLREGDTIQTADATYTIGKLLGLGGSSTLYAATKSGSYLDYAIKECFPLSPDSFKRVHGVIQPDDPDETMLSMYRKAFLHERQVGQEIQNTTRRAVSAWDELIPISITTRGETSDDVSGGIFSVMERLDKKGRFFDELLDDIHNACPPKELRKTFGLPSIQMTVQMMEEALTALQDVHNAGYCFADIHDGNVFFSGCNAEQGKAGIGHLIDFGAARKLENDNYIATEPVPSTDGFRPPEVNRKDLFNEDGLPVLSKRSDVFSMGCLMLRCVFTPAKIKTLGNSPCVGSNALSELNGKAIGCTEETRKIVNKILNKATQYNPKCRYADASEMLDAILKLKKHMEQPVCLLSANLSTPECFDLVLESREDEMRAIDRSIAKQKPLFIWGFPGLGKTELSVAYARTYNPDKSYLVRYKGSMRDTIISLQFTDMDDPDLRNLSKDERAIAEEKIYKKKLDELKKYPSNSLLIIDNFDSKTKTFQEMIQEPDYFDLLGINMQILITTRSQPDDVTPAIQPLKEEYLLKLMKRFIGPKKVSDDLLLQLLDVCGYHTLSAELIGKAIGNKLRPVSPGYILQKLRNNQLKQAVLPKSRTSKDRVFDEDTIYGHLKTLFDIACLSEVEKNVMRHAALLPASGVHTCIFLRAECSDENHQAVKQLISRGWLHISQEQIISIHPLVSDLVYEELGLSYEKCKLFLYWMFDGAANDQMYRISTASSRAWSDSSNNPFDLRTHLVEQFGYMEYSNPLEEYEDCKKLSHMIAEVFANASIKIPGWNIPYAAMAAYCFDMAHDQEMCLKYSHQALDNIVQKINAHPDKDWHKHKIFTSDERWAISDIRRIWCPELEERSWDIECAELYGNELFMDHSKKPIQVQSIYTKLRYIFIRN